MNTEIQYNFKNYENTLKQSDYWLFDVVVKHQNYKFGKINTLLLLKKNNNWTMINNFETANIYDNMIHILTIIVLRLLLISQ